MTNLLRVIGWVLVWLACGALGVLLLAWGSPLGFVPLFAFALTGIDAASEAFRK